MDDDDQGRLDRPGGEHRGTGQPGGPDRQPPVVLAHLVDRPALDEDSGPRAVLKLAAPAAWLDEGGEVEIAVPARLSCARCDGGGCEGCGRSGALRAPSDASLRRLRATLPPHAGPGFALRLVRPFGDDADVAQLVVELRPGEPSDALVRIAAARALVPLGAGSSGPAARPWISTVLAALALAAATAWWIAARWP